MSGVPSDAEAKKRAKAAYDKARGERADVRASWAEASRKWYSKPENKRKKSRRVMAYYRTAAGGLHMRVSRGMRACLQGTKRGGVSWLSLVDYTLEDLRRHMERQFLPGMSWENMGDWHIDHIIPLASFSIAGPECPELRRAWALTNLRPLWARENLSKRDKVLSLL